MVMATDWCQEQSQANVAGTSVSTSNDEIAYGTCDTWCEFALAFRSLTTVAVYLLPRASRAELVDVQTTCRLLRSRVASAFCGRRVFSSNNPPATDLLLLTSPSQTHQPGTRGRFIEAHEVHMDRRLAEGTFGVVWRGRWGKGPDVAIKVLKSGGVDADGDPIDANAMADFQTECTMLGRLNHPHLLKLFGFGCTAGGSWFIVTELMALGSLRGVLRDSSRPLPWPTRLSIALEISLAMEYLHAIPIVHRVRSFAALSLWRSENLSCPTHSHYLHTRRRT
jgi:hypothetical protein